MAMSPEHIARRAAARRREKHMNSLTPISHLVTVLDGPNDLVRVQLDGCTLEGGVEAVNVQLERAGYRPIRLTLNMLNPTSRWFAVDYNTPSYLDPGSEAYHCT